MIMMNGVKGLTLCQCWNVVEKLEVIHTKPKEIYILLGVRQLGMGTCHEKHTLGSLQSVWGYRRDSQNTCRYSGA